MKALFRQLVPAIAALAALTALFGVAYPLVATGIGQVAFRHRVNGSIITLDGVAVGSELLGQSFAAPGYFHPRPSAAGDGLDGAASSGSNLGPLNPDLLDAVAERAAVYRDENGLSSGFPVPVDAVTSSASGLDPHISLANARLQAQRVADARGVSVDAVIDAIDENVDDRPLGVLGDPGVNVLELNVALDRLP
jgi:K+-transporting ATPase ATPase C chain